MDDLISRQAVVDYICHYDCGCAFNECKGEERCDFVDAIMTLPSAESKTGVWQESTIPERYVTHRCSNCGYGVRRNGLHSYCPNCGAKMEVEN